MSWIDRYLRRVVRRVVPLKKNFCNTNERQASVTNLKMKVMKETVSYYEET